VTPRPPRQAGFGLFDALVALAVLAFGLLALTQLQTRLVAQGSEAQHRMLATQLADELLNTLLVDTGNAACYTLPPAGACGSATASATAANWKLRALAALPGPATASSVLAASGRFTVTMTWPGKESDELRTHQVISDVRGN
jgi:type IV pilus assembly protein PilV